MTFDKKRKVRRLEIVALVLCVAMLLVVLAGGGGGDSRDRTFVLKADTNGIVHLYGVPLGNSFLRRGVLQMVSLVGGEVELEPAKGWMTNAVAKSNMWLAAEDINRLGLSPGAKAMARLRADKTALERNSRIRVITVITNGQ